jgi:hypothetical protein
MPWVSHFSGSSAAICCIQLGSPPNTKKTPEKNCRTTANADTDVVTDAALPRSAEVPMPSTVPASDPSSATQANVAQCAASAGSGTS